MGGDMPGLADAIQKIREEHDVEFAETLENWPNCDNPDCGNKQCRWSNTPYCYRCAEQQLGAPEMLRRFNAKHDITLHHDQILS